MIVRADWTAEEAMAAQREFEMQGGAPSSPNGPVSQWAALHAIAECEARWKAGEKRAVLAAVAECARTGLAMPDWLAAAYLDAYRSVAVRYDAKSWFEAFGQPHGKGSHLRALKKKRDKSVLVWNEVRRRAQMGVAIDDELFSEVGRHFGLGLTLTKEYYSEWKTRLGLAADPEAHAAPPNPKK